MEERSDFKVIKDEAIGLEYEISANGMVQATGELAGVEIYFRAKNQEWIFDIANRDGKLPSDGYSGGFFKKEKYDNASSMTLNEAVIIIRKCIDEYLQVKNT